MARNKGSKNKKGVGDNKQYKSMFCVYNNPNKKPIWEDGESHYSGNDMTSRAIIGWEDTEFTGLSPQQTIEAFVNKWCDVDPENRTAIATYCIAHFGTDHELPHIHAILCSKKAFRFNNAKDLFPSMHLSETKGTKKQALAYIRKEGEFEEKDEIIVCEYQRGEIIGREGSRNVMQAIGALIEEGYKPIEIYNMNFSYRQFDRIIEKAYLEKKISETPVIQDINVYWHFGKSGTGKSYTMSSLCEEYGKDEVYIITDLGSSGAFDGYCGQDIIFIDELRPHTIKYEHLLTLLDQYTHQIHARYYNKFKCWKEVHITTLYHPEDFYDEALPEEKEKDIDTYDQLRRRITHCVYHYKSASGEYKTEEIKLEGDEVQFVKSHCQLKKEAYDSVQYGYYDNMEAGKYNFTNSEDLF